MIATITWFRPGRGANKIPNFPRKALFWGKIRKLNRGRRDIPGSVEEERTENG
jgi:hypothetical protein